MSDYIIGTDAFREHLNNWLFTSKQPDAEFLFRNKPKIPPMFRDYKKKLYRGMKVDSAFLATLESNKPIIFSTHTSWSKSDIVAKKFASDPKYMMGTSPRESTVTVLLTKLIPSTSQILDIDTFVVFMGEKQLEMMGYDEMNIDSALKEKEVLISKGIRITKKDVSIIK